jgi:hypothetical protein
VISITQFYDPYLNQIIVIEESGIKFVLEYKWPESYSNNGYAFQNARVTSPQFPDKTWFLSVNLDTVGDVREAFQDLLSRAQGETDAARNN